MIENDAPAAGYWKIGIPLIPLAAQPKSKTIEATSALVTTASEIGKSLGSEMFPVVKARNTRM